MRVLDSIVASSTALVAVRDPEFMGLPHYRTASHLSFTFSGPKDSCAHTWTCADRTAIKPRRTFGFHASFRCFARARDDDVARGFPRGGSLIPGRSAVQNLALIPWRSKRSRARYSSACRTRPPMLQVIIDEYLERSGMDLRPAHRVDKSSNGDVADRIDQRRGALARLCEKFSAVVRDQPSPQGRVADSAATSRPVCAASLCKKLHSPTPAFHYMPVKLSIEGSARSARWPQSR
jgi:hypothetical protein